MIKIGLIQRIYIILITLAILFHVFNNLQFSDSLKVFHVFTLAACGVGFFLKGSNKILGVLFNLFFVWTILSSMISPVQPISSSLIKFIIIVSSLIFLPRTPINKLVLAINIIIPIALLALLRQYFLQPTFRYQGFYEDPNYFCTTLLTFYFFIQLIWNEVNNIWIKIVLISEIIIILLLISLSLSRTGLLCMGIMSIVFFRDVFLKRKIVTLLILLIILFLINIYFGEFVENAIEGFAMRESHSSDTVSGAANLRWEISKRGISYLLTHPLFILQGIGFGTYSGANILDGWHAETSHIDHNTITSCFSEQGLVGIILFLRLFYLLYIKLKTNKSLKARGIQQTCICTLCVFLLFAASINQSIYFPFWLVIFTLVNLASVNDITKRHVICQ